MTYRIQRIRSLDSILHNYSALFCDIWGVLYDGRTLFSPAISALFNAKEKGIPVILITNSPRCHIEVEQDLTSVGIPRSSYNAIITSGDVTRDLIKKQGKKIFHIGPSLDHSLYDTLCVDLVSQEEAETIVCTGLFYEQEDKPEEYRNMLKKFLVHDLPFICANPDIMVRQGETMIWCAGALANEYEKEGGRVFIAGKPYNPIYERAYEKISEIIGERPKKEKILAIGDNMLTDTKGACEQGLDMLYVAQGVHMDAYSLLGKINEKKLDDFLSIYNHKPKAIIDFLK